MRIISHTVPVRRAIVARGGFSSGRGFGGRIEVKRRRHRRLWTPDGFLMKWSSLFRASMFDHSDVRTCIVISVGIHAAFVLWLALGPGAKAFDPANAEPILVDIVP